MHFNKGVDKRVSLFILIITVLDFLHLLLLAKQGFGEIKIAISFIIAMIIYKYGDFKKSL